MGRDSIYENGKKNSPDTSHNDVYDVLREAHSLHGSFQKVPFHPVVSLSHISFDTHKAFLVMRVREKMEYFMGN
jgi:hypothetical protein